MPVLHVRALSQKNQNLVQTALKKTCLAVAETYGCKPEQVWATWEEIKPGLYVEGAIEADEQPRSTHPPIVELLCFEGKDSETIERVLLATAQTLSRELGIPENIFVSYHEAKSGRVISGNGIIRKKPQAQNIERTYSKAPWEKTVGYCRAIRKGNQIAVTGTAPVDNSGKVFAPNRAYEQAKRCLEIIQTALSGLGADKSDIIRTRMFVTDISRWQEFGRAHGEFFSDCPPATTMVEVKSLIDSQMLIEIEADAVVS